MHNRVNTRTIVAGTFGLLAGAGTFIGLNHFLRLPTVWEGVSATASALFTAGCIKGVASNRKNTPSQPIPGIANDGTNQCYANVLVHVLMEQWDPILDEQNKRDKADLDPIVTVQGPVKDALDQLLNIRQSYAQGHVVSAEQVGTFIKAVHKLRDDTQIRSDGGDPCELLTPLVQKLKQSSAQTELVPYYAQLQPAQNEYDKDQGYIGTTLSGFRDPQTIQEAAQERFKDLHAPSYLPLRIQRTTRSGFGYHPHAIAVSETISIDTHSYRLSSAIIYDHKHSHYIAYIRTPQGWFQADDRRITESHPPTACSMT